MPDKVGAIASLQIVGASAFFTGSILSLEVAQSIPVIDVTPLSAVSGGRLVDKGRVKSWTMTGTMYWSPSNTPPVGTKGQINLTYADATGTVYRWSTGFLSEITKPIQHEEAIEASFTLALSGDVTVNPT